MFLFLLNDPVFQFTIITAKNEEDETSKNWLNGTELQNKLFLLNINSMYANFHRRKIEKEMGSKYFIL